MHRAAFFSHSKCKIEEKIATHMHGVKMFCKYCVHDRDHWLSTRKIAVYSYIHMFSSNSIKCYDTLVLLLYSTRMCGIYRNISVRYSVQVTKAMSKLNWTTPFFLFSFSTIVNFIQQKIYYLLHTHSHLHIIFLLLSFIFKQIRWNYQKKYNNQKNISIETVDIEQNAHESPLIVGSIY